jgi:hypothetical protein
MLPTKKRAKILQKAFKQKYPKFGINSLQVHSPEAIDFGHQTAITLMTSHQRPITL